MPYSKLERDIQKLLEESERTLREIKQQIIRDYFYNVVREANNSQHYYYCHCTGNRTLHKFKDPLLKRYISNKGYYNSIAYCTRCYSENTYWSSELFEL